MMEETLQIREKAQRSSQDASHRNTFPFGLRPSRDAYARQAAKSIQIQSGRQQPWRPEGRNSRPSRPTRRTVHLPQGRDTLSWLLATEEDRTGARCITCCTGSHASGRQRVLEGPDPNLPQRPKILTAMHPGGFGERPTTGRRDGLRGGTSDPRQRESCPKAGGGATPGGTPVRP
jgi:hypothetical protein